MTARALLALPLVGKPLFRLLRGIKICSSACWSPKTCLNCSVWNTSAPWTETT